MERFLRAAAARGTPLVGLCTGSFILAELGLLDGRRASVSWFHVHEFRQRYPAVMASAETLFTVDERVSTCSGGLGAADLAAELVRKRLTDPAVEDAAKILLLDGLRDGGAPQPQSGAFLRARDRLVRRALLLMESNVASALPIAAVAARMGCSTRQLQRRFLADLGATPSQAYMHIRMQCARRLLVRTDRTVEDIGASAGFVNPSHFIRVFHKAVGKTPMRFRSRCPE
jgi:transcriptional regulator GlxA family with amidase domain